MLGRSPSTIRRVIVRLVNKGWLRERNNPRCAWDKTKQYRVNLLRLKNNLAELGYPLQGCGLSTAACGQVSPKLGCEAPGADSQVQAASSDAPTAASHQQNDVSTWRDAAAIPEITAEITTEITRKNTNKHKEEEPPAGGGRVSAGVDLLVVEPDAGKERQKTESGGTYSPEFEAFWQVYPKQRNKWQAWRQWRRALKRQRPRPVVAAELIAAAQNYALRSILQEPRFIMFPATFLGPDCRYLDYLDTPWPEANGNNVPAELSPEAASALVELINQAPEALRDKTTVHVRYRLLQSGFDLAYGEAGQYVLGGLRGQQHARPLAAISSIPQLSVADYSFSRSLAKLSCQVTPNLSCIQLNQGLKG